MFAVKCASHLQSGVGVMLVDIVTERSGNLHAKLLHILQLTMRTAAQRAHDLYATAYRRVAGERPFVSSYQTSLDGANGTDHATADIEPSHITCVESVELL